MAKIYMEKRGYDEASIDLVQQIKPRFRLFNESRYMGNIFSNIMM